MENTNMENIHTENHHEDDNASIRSHVTFGTEPILHSLRSHKDLYPIMVENERLVEREALDRRIANRPICRAFRKKVAKSKVPMRQLRKRLQNRVEGSKAKIHPFETNLQLQVARSNSKLCHLKETLRSRVVQTIKRAKCSIYKKEGE